MQKSKVVHFNSQLLSIQWTVILRNGIWFLLVHASTVKESRPGASYFLHWFNNISILNLLNEIKITTCSSFRKISFEFLKFSSRSRRNVSFEGIFIPGRINWSISRNSLHSTALKGWSLTIAQRTTLFRNPFWLN